MFISLLAFLQRVLLTLGSFKGIRIMKETLHRIAPQPGSSGSLRQSCCKVPCCCNRVGDFAVASGLACSFFVSRRGSLRVEAQGCSDSHNSTLLGLFRANSMNMVDFNVHSCSSWQKKTHEDGDSMFARPGCPGCGQGATQPAVGG